MVDRRDPLQLNLPDVLLQLPLLGVVDDFVWQPLLPAGRSSLRQASRSCRQLADSLITDLSLVTDLSQYAEPPEDRSAQPPSPLSEADDAPPAASPAPLTHEQREAWQQAVDAHAHFLVRLPRLTALRLWHWPDEAALLAMLTSYGTASGFRLTHLTLRGAPPTAAAGERVRQACPRLETLQLYCREEGSADLSEDVLLTLQELPLTSLTMSATCRVSIAALGSLSHLSHLRHIDLRLCYALPQQLVPSLAALTHLQHCRVGQTFADLSFLDVAALFTLSHLTHLHLCLQHNVTPLGTPMADEVAAAVAPLASLAKLQYLSLGFDCVVDSIVYAPLLQLSSLTALSAARFELSLAPLPWNLQPPRGAQLPTLRSLQMSAQMRPSHLLHALEPLLPLRSLESLCCDDPLCLDVGHIDDADAASQARSLQLAMGHLARAPRLRLLQRLDIATIHPLHMSCTDIGEGLRPLAGILHTLNIDQLNLAGVEWGALGACLPGLQLLELWVCNLPGDALAVLAARWPGLGHLRVRRCLGVSRAGWLGLAAGRVEALKVSMDPCREVEWVQPCQALQERLFGRRHITFVAM